MAKAATATQPEYQLKHRLTGAIILMAAAVLVIPLLLPDPGIEASIEETAVATETTKKTFRSKIEPLDTSSRDIVADAPADGSSEDDKPALLTAIKEFKSDSSQEEGVESAPAANSPPTTESAPEKKVEAVASLDQLPKVTIAASPPSDTPAASSSSETSTTPATTEEGWAVRVGTFSKQANVDSVSALLKNSGFKPRTTPASIETGDATRIWLGPYEDRETAEKVSVRLKTLTGEKGYVTRHDS